ncbi:MAG: hypothetical protein R3F61_22895 [Myxococcota bacterium]
MPTTWSLERVTLSVPARQPGRTVVWALVPWAMLAGALLIPAVLTQIPDPHTVVDRCTYSDDPACLPVQPLLAGRPWPDTWAWQEARARELSAGAEPVDARPDLSSDDPANVAFLEMAAAVSLWATASDTPLSGEARLRARREADWLRDLERGILEENIELARATGSLDVEGRANAAWGRWNARLVFGLVLVVGGGLALRSSVRRLGDLGAVDLELTAHRLTMDGRTHERSEVWDLALVGPRVRLRLKDGRVQWSSPLPTSEVDEADVVCAAFAALDPTVDRAAVPAALEALMQRSKPSLTP